MTTYNRDALLSESLDFDHIIAVYDDGSIADNAIPNDLYAPDAYEPDSMETTLDGWELPLSGFTGQDRYTGPWLHNSEVIAGGVASYVFEHPGYWVAIYASYPANCPECSQAGLVYDEDHNEVPCPNIAAGTCSPEGYTGEDAETVIEGWTLAYRPFAKALA